MQTIDFQMAAAEPSSAADMPASVRKSLRIARRIIVKIGTPVATHVDGNIALGRIAGIVEQIAMLRQEGRDVAIVTSGAIGTGAVRMRRSHTLHASMFNTVKASLKKDEINENAAAALGQAVLINMYEALFSKYDLSCAQVLVTEEDLQDAEALQQVKQQTATRTMLSCMFVYCAFARAIDDRPSAGQRGSACVCAADLHGSLLACISPPASTFSSPQVRDTASELLQLGTIPIINENDAVSPRTQPVLETSTNEVGWDNDVIASRIASELRADLLILLTDMDGLYTSSAMSDPPIRLRVWEEGVTQLSHLRRDRVQIDALGSLNERGKFARRTRIGATGLNALVQAATLATDHGVRAAVITTGHYPLSVLRVLRGDDVGTLFFKRHFKSKL